MTATSIINRLEAWGPGSAPGLGPTEAMAYCRRLALGHYENFSVLSRFVPSDMRAGASVVYAFCRWADDLSDEIGDCDRSLQLLDWWRTQTLACFDGEATHPVFVALNSLMERHAFTPEPFLNLIDAFEQDQRVSRYETWDQVIDYCRRSADPVGRLVLRVADQDHDPDVLAASDAVCTALQLTNHWQDVRRDLIERDRLYIPDDCHEVADFEHRLRQTIEAGFAPDREFYGDCRHVIRSLVERTWPLFERTDDLLQRLTPELRPMIWLFSAGGSQVLHRIETINYETVLFRPRLSRFAKLCLLMKAKRASQRPAA